MTIADATAKLLAIRKKVLTNPEIVEAIRAGGVILNLAQPVNTVGSVLRRRQADEGDIIRVGKMWGLSEWYPNAAPFARRGRKEKVSELPKETKRPRGRPRKSREPQEAQAKEAAN